MAASDVAVQRLLTELAAVAFQLPQVALELPDMLAAKLKVLQLLGRHLQLFTDRAEGSDRQDLAARLQAALKREQAFDGGEQIAPRILRLPSRRAR